jgi:FlaA1/EpsC-like NDP-sugar epimerase
MTDKPLEGRRALVTGATGSLGKVLIRRLLSGEFGRVEKVIAFSRDEAKQHEMRMEYLGRRTATDEVIYRTADQALEFAIGDVRDYASVCGVLRRVDIVFNAAALKQVPTCEYFPHEAVQTNVQGAENIVRGIEALQLPIATVIAVSTDKACKPVNVMGMTKALQERVIITGNLRCPGTRFLCVRYGNVLASRGSVIPLFRDQIRTGGPVTITTPEMTRFLLSLNEAVDLIFRAVASGQRGETYVPCVPSARVVDIATALMGPRKLAINFTGVRPGEKVHEILVSEEERHRTTKRGTDYVIGPILPELGVTDSKAETLQSEYGSADDVMTAEQVRLLLEGHGLLLGDQAEDDGVLRQ